MIKKKFKKTLTIRQFCTEQKFNAIYQLYFLNSAKKIYVFIVGKLIHKQKLTLSVISIKTKLYTNKKTQFSR